MVTLREPVDRAFSSFLHMRKQGRVRGSFEEALAAESELVDHGMYGRLLERWFDVFDQTSFVITMFDDLRTDSESYAAGLFETLGIDQMTPPEHVLAPALERSESRSAALGTLMSRGSSAIRDIGLPAVVTRVKTNRLVQKVLYRPFDEAPTLDPATEASLRDRFHDDVHATQALTGIAVADRWGYV